MPAPLDQAKRDAITADINAGQKTRNQIARDHSVSGATVGSVDLTVFSGSTDR